MMILALVVVAARILPPAEAPPPAVPSVLNLRAVLEVDAAGRIAHIPRHFEDVKKTSPQSLMEGAPNATTLKEYDHLRYATVRLQAVVHERNLLEPWRKEKGRATFVGSGFVVRNTETGPLVVTNAHVVNDAQDLVISIPAVGQQMYQAQPLLVNHDMDIALVSLVSAEEYKLMKDQVGFDLPVVKLQETPPKLGQEVVAMGYPLGVTSVKITKGVLSGHEQVSQLLAYQQSAPISPGNSGGPLFADGTDTVIGINFAAAIAEGAQAQNYAIPAFRVKQMLTQLDGPNDDSRQYSQERCREDRRHCSFVMPQLHAEAAPGSPELYERYGCEKGIFLTRTTNESIFAHADPPIPAKSFIFSINGVDIDEYGAAPADEYFGDPVPFTEHMFLEPSLQSVEVGVCSCGQVGTAKVPLQYTGDFKDEAKIKSYDEVNLDFAGADYERFAGVTVQELSANLVQTLVQERQRMDLVKYLVEPDQQSALVVTHVEGLSDAGGIFRVGDVVKTLNGKEVSTLAEFRENFAPAGSCSADGGSDAWVMEARGGREIVTDFHAALDAARKVAPTEAVAAAVKSAGLALVQQQEKATTEADSLNDLAESVVRPVEERFGVRRGGQRWNNKALGLL
jgi:S1-C subfamily serine protease